MPASRPLPFPAPQSFFLLRAATAAAILSFVLPAAADSNCGLDQARLEQVRAIGRQLVERNFAPGIVTTLYCDGKPLLVAADGMADAERRKAMTPSHLFRIYSMTKPVTSLAILMLAEEGKLGLDDPLARFIPEFGQAGALDATDGSRVPLVRPVTVRDLLRHTAGIPYRGSANAVEKMYVKRGIDHGGGAVVLPEDGSEPVSTLSEMARRIAGTPMLDQPGQRFRYGNATDVLGRVIEIASGQSLGRFLSERIFHPLGMNDTAFLVPAQAVDRLSAAYWSKTSAAASDRVLRQADTSTLKSGGLTLAEDPTKSVFAGPRAIEFGGAGLVSTAADYQRFLQMLRNGGGVDGKRLVGAGSVAEMVRNQLPPAALAGSALAAQGLGFGLGVAVVTEPSLAPAPLAEGSYFWGGAASTYFWVDPARRLTGVVMTQVFGGDVGPFYLDILRAVYGPRQPTAEMQPRRTSSHY